MVAGQYTHWNFIRGNQKYFTLTIEQHGHRGAHLITLSEETSFLNKGSILQMFKDLPENTKLVIDCTKSKSIHYDVIEIIRDFQISAKARNIAVEIKSNPAVLNLFNS